MSFIKRLLAILLLCAPCWGTTQFFLTTVAPTEASAYNPCTATRRAVHAVRGAGVTTSVTNSAASGTDIATTQTAGGNELCFVSDPVLTAFTMSGTITMNIWGFESATQCNCIWRVKVYKWNGASETLVSDSNDSGGEMPTSNAARNWTNASPTSTAFAIGDRIVIRTRITNNGTMGGGRTVTMNYAGTTAAASGDTYVTFNENIALKRTRTVKSSAGDYTTLNGWSSGEAGDLTTLLESRQAELYAFQDTTPATLEVSTWKTSATYFIKIYTTGTGRNTTGIYDGSNYYRLEVSGTNTYAIRIATYPAHVWIDGLQIKVTFSTGATKAGIVATSLPTTGSPVIKVSNTLLQGVLSGTVDTVRGIFCGSSSSPGATGYFWNNIAYGFYDTQSFDSSGLMLGFDASNWTNYSYNNTAYGNNNGIGSFSTRSTVINTLASGNDLDFDNIAINAASDYNANSDAFGVPGAHSHTGTVSFVNAAGGNFQLTGSDTTAKGNGTTDPGSGLFSDDITGATRTVPWDIGAWIAQSSTCSQSIALMGVGCR